MAGGMDMEAESLIGTLETALGCPFSSGNRIEVLRNGVEIFPPMLEAIGGAAENIEFLTFVYWSGDIARRFAHALAGAAGRGVCVRVLLDAVGAAKMDPELVRLMREAGAEVAWFRPLKRVRFWNNNERTHRKLLICDGHVAFTGGVGIAEEWEGDARSPDEWRDTHFRVEGPAVAALRSGFIGNWAEARTRTQFARTRQAAAEPGSANALVVRSVASQHWSDIATALRPLLRAATTRLRITTPYFVPDATLVEDLAAVASRGARVTILTAGRYHDHPVARYAGQRHYQPLLAAGISIYEYDRTMLHAKVITMDERWSCIGSANLNQRSLGKDDEICLICDDASLAERLDRDFDQDLEHAREIDGRSWRRRGLWQRAKEQLSGLVDANF